MTTQEMVDELKASLGNRTDLLNARYVTWLNWAVFDLCGFHQKKIFTPKRFHVLEDEVLFKTDVKNNLCATTITATSFEVAVADRSSDDDYYNDCVVELTDYSGDAPDNLLNQKFVIFDYDGTTFVATIAGTWVVNPDMSTYYSIYRRMFALSDTGYFPATLRVWAVERLEKLSGGTVLPHRSWEELVGVDITEVGEPARFANRGNKIMFDKPADDEYFYRAFIYRLPVSLSAGDMTASCEIPEDWHEVIVQGAVYRGHDKLMEPLRAKEARARYRDMANNKQDPFQMEDVHKSRSLKVKVS